LEITDTIKKKKETLIDASKEVGPEVNAEKTEYMLLPITRTQGKFVTYRQLIGPLKMWHSSNMWE
jgi:hypothetical protein